MSRFEDFKIEFGVLCDYVGNDDVVIIPDGVREIAGWGFQGCFCKTVVIPASVRKIDEYAFVECHGLRKIVVKSGNKVFFSVNGCLFNRKPRMLLKVADVSISKFVFPEGVTSIGNSAFLGCEMIQELVVPEGVTEIGEWTFFGCSRLSRLWMPESVLSVGEDAFTGCDLLKIIGKVGSFAEKYALENGIEFEVV